MTHQNTGGLPNNFINKSKEPIKKALEFNPDALVLIGGNENGCNIRQKEIFDLVNNCHNNGIQAYWYRTPHNARLDISDQIIPGKSYVIVDLDIMSISDPIQQSLISTKT